MRYILILIAVLFLATSCKTRQYAKTSVHTVTVSSDTTHRDSTHKATQVTVDSSKSGSLTVMKVDDTSTTTTTLTPVTGTTTTVGKDGSITGNFSTVHQTKTEHKQSQQTKRDTTQKAIKTIGTDSSHLSSSSSRHTSTVKDSVTKKGSSNSTIAANFPWYYVLAIIAGLAVLAFIFFKYIKPKLI